MNQRQHTAYVFLVLVLSGCAALRAQATSGTINGSITDQSQAAVTNADIAITSEATRAVVRVSSGSSGLFAAAALPVGRYTITVTKSGFQTYSESGIIVEPSGVRTVNVTLQLGAVASNVTVTAARIETTTNGSGTFGQVTSALDPRIMELSLRYQF
jgi:hypothetical protein